MATRPSTPPRARQQIIAEDVRDLHRLGYAQQLYREMGGFSNFAISFSIISVLHRCDSALRVRPAVCRAGDQYGRLAAGECLRAVRRRVDGGVGLGVSDRRRFVFLGPTVWAGTAGHG